MGQLGRVVTLGPQDVPAIQALFQRCGAFFQLVFGAPPAPDAGAVVPHGRADVQERHSGAAVRPPTT